MKLRTLLFVFQMSQLQDLFRSDKGIDFIEKWKTVFVQWKNGEKFPFLVKQLRICLWSLSISIKWSDRKKY